MRVEEQNDTVDISFANIVGFMMHAMVCICPNIIYVINIICRIMLNPKRAH